MQLLPRFCLLLFCWMCLNACKQGAACKPVPKTVSRAFYYWKSTFRLGAYEQRMLDSLRIHDIYVKFFDVVWNPQKQAAMPVAPLLLQDSSYRRYRLWPVVFITNDCLRQLDTNGVNTLAADMTRYYKGLVQGYDFTEPPGPLQIDCDWTAGTRDRYFHLLKILQNNVDSTCRPNSATIRMYQLKYASRTGVPPVQNGLIMCYNMGNLKNPVTGNSIIESTELEKYIDGLKGYPLQCDVAFPLFDWYVWFSENHYKGLLYPHQLPGLALEKNRYIFNTDTVINGLDFKKGDMLRYENSDVQEVLRCAETVNRRLENTRPRVILYHLDSVILSKYRQHELEQIFNAVH